MKLSIVIPIYNEENTLEPIVRKVQEIALPEGFDKEIILVNDGSTDNTSEILKKFENDDNTRIFHQEKNEGKTSALKRGFKEAIGDYILIQDADLEYDPTNYAKLLQPVIEKQSPVVYGSRFLGNIKHMKPINRYSNVFSNFSFNALYGTKLTDINTCFKLFKSEILKNMEIVSDHFTFETEISAKLTKQNIEILEVPIDYEARTIAEGKKISWSKAWKMYWGIFRFK